MKEFLAGYYATRARRGTLILIAGNILFFGALLAIMFYLRWAAEEWPAPFHFASLLMVVALTMFCVSGSVTCEVGARATKFADRETVVRWFAVAIACWLTFMFLEVVEWVRLVYLVRLGPDTAFGGSFLALTVAHWIAAGGCVFWMGYAVNDTKRHDAVAPAMYSHFLVGVWLVLVITLYLPNSTLEGF